MAGPQATTRFEAGDCAVRQLHARCIDAVWRRDTTALVECFAPDAEWKVAGMIVRGHAEIGGLFDTLKASWRRVMMSFGLPILEVRARTAAGRTPFGEYIIYNDGRVVRTLGHYYEHFVEQADGWRFQSRRCDFHYFGPPDLSAPFCDFRKYGPPPGMPGAEDPISFPPSD